jgi:tRNA-intron endonuclease, archaea type
MAKKTSKQESKKDKEPKKDLHKEHSKDNEKGSSAGLVKAIFSESSVVTENNDAARDLYAQSRFGAVTDSGKVSLSLIEAYYLIEKNKIEVYSSSKKKMSEDAFLAKAKKLESNFLTRYAVFKDFRNRGYIIKTALKFGADFRVYDRGVKPGEDHAKWIVYPVPEASYMTWYDFAAKNRVAHSTKKRLLIGIVDEESSVTYYEVRWLRP